MKYVAAIDVGSHEISMSIAQLRNKKEALLQERVLRTVPTGVDSYRYGSITPAVTVQIIDALRSFRQKLLEYPGAEVLAVATSAFREAENRLFVLNQIKRDCGFDIRILSNNEENCYQLSSVVHRVPDFPALCKEATLSLELGAGSIQLSLFDKGEFIYSQNILLGSLRLRSLLSELEQQEGDLTSLMAEYIAGDMAYYRNFEPSGIHFRHLIVNGGSLRYFRRLCGLPADGCVKMTRNQFETLLIHLKQQKIMDLSLNERIPEVHAGLLLPNALVVSEVLGFTELDEILLPGSGLEDGLLLEAAQRHSAFKPRRKISADQVSAAWHLTRRFRIDHEHCEVVEQLALKIFDQSRKLHGLGDEERLFLQLAAIMHNVGKYISMREDDQRSFEIVSSAEIPGLSREDLQFIALLVYCHNGQISMQDRLMEGMNDEKKLKLYKLAAILAMANALDAGHKQKIRELKLKRVPGGWQMGLLADDDITLELWTLRRHCALFEKIFALSLIFKKRSGGSL